MATCESSRENIPQLNEDVYGIILKFVQQNKRIELDNLVEKVRLKCSPIVYGSIEMERSKEGDIESNQNRLIFHATAPLLQDVTLKFDNLGLARMLWQSKPEREVLKDAGKIIM